MNTIRYENGYETKAKATATKKAFSIFVTFVAALCPFWLHTVRYGIDMAGFMHRELYIFGFGLPLWGIQLGAVAFWLVFVVSNIIMED